jgi:CRP-like cAMP-binding protein/thioredoxin reductase/Fe-S-cluster-containing hydrogenase component 2
MSDHFSIAIIGAGPAGLGAATNAAHHGMSHILIEKREIGNTVFDYQLRKLVMAEPGRLPLRGFVPFEAGSREQVLAGWGEAVNRKEVNVRKAEILAIQRVGPVFELTTGGGKITADKVILSIGVQGTPRKLGVSGEDPSLVAYTLADPDAFEKKSILVVGAGDAAIENALALCEHNKVFLLNRTDDFPRAKDANASKIFDAIRVGKVRMFANSEVLRIEGRTVVISGQEGEIAVDVDHVIARLGCIMPRKFLESCGIQFPSADPAAVPQVDETYQSNVPGLYILGALIGYPLIKQAINQGYEVIEHLLGNNVEPADQGLIDEKLAELPGSSAEKLSKFFAALPLFKDLSSAQFRELIIESKVHQPQAGDLIFERNDYTDTFFSVVEGSVDVLIPSKSKSLTLESGTFFGEMGLLSGRRRTATVKAAASSILLETPRKQMLKLMNSVPSVKRQLDEAFMLRALQTSAFPDAEAEFLKEVVGRAQLKAFKKGETLFKEGDIGDCLYVIRKGSVKIARRNSAGQEITQTYLAAGNLVGEMALMALEPRPRSATVSAVVPCDTIVISKADFSAILERNQALRMRLAEQTRAREIENAGASLDSGVGNVLDFMMAQGVTDADNFLLIDSDKCIGCDNCESACAATHGGYSRLDRKGGKSFASIQIPISCRHCENPLCMLDCPPDALVRQPNGEVVIRDNCIGCGNCVRNCPYGVIRMVYPENGSGFSLLTLFGFGKKKEKGAAKAGKCDLCSGLVGGPACVRACPTGAALRVNPSKMLHILNEKRAV